MTVRRRHRREERIGVVHVAGDVDLETTVVGVRVPLQQALAPGDMDDERVGDL